MIFQVIYKDNASLRKIFVFVALALDTTDAITWRPLVAQVVL